MTGRTVNHPKEKTMSDQLPPERRLSLYTRLAQVFREAGADGAADAALEQASAAIKESPELTAAVRELVDRIGRGTDDLEA